MDDLTKARLRALCVCGIEGERPLDCGVCEQNLKDEDAALAAVPGRKG